MLETSKAWPVLRSLLVAVAILLMGGACGTGEKASSDGAGGGGHPGGDGGAGAGGGIAYIETSEVVLNFGVISLGSEKSLRFTVTNAWTSPLELRTRLVGADAFLFEDCFKGSDACEATSTLASGSKEEVEVRYLGKETGRHEATLHLMDGAERSLGTVSLRGRTAQTTGNSLECTPSSVRFGAVPVGRAVSGSFLCTNASTLDLMVDSLTSTHPFFAVSVLNGDESSGIRDEGYVAGERFRVVVDFAPTDDVPVEGVIRLETTPGGVLELMVASTARKPCILDEGYAIPMDAPPRFILQRAPLDRNEDSVVDEEDFIGLTYDAIDVSPVAEGGVTQWSYDALANEIVFPPDRIPSVGTWVVAKYVHQCD